MKLETRINELPEDLRKEIILIQSNIKYQAMNRNEFKVSQLRDLMNYKISTYFHEPLDEELYLRVQASGMIFD